MAVLERSELEASPLADLHAIANQLGLEGFRRLRKPELIDAILGEGKPGENGAAEPDAAAVEEAGEDEPAESEPAESERPRRRRGLRSPVARRRATATAKEPAADEGEEPRPARADAAAGPSEGEERPRRSRAGAAKGPADEERPRRTRERAPRATPERAPSGERPPERVAEGVVELLDNGSAFLRVDPPESSDDDVYISAAQVRRCELVSGDRVAGPVRQPRRSERHPSLAQIDTINGELASAVSEGTRYEDLPAAHPSERLALDSEDPTLKAIEWLTPIGRGSRAVIAGAARAGKTETLRRLAGALAGRDGLELTVVLAGARPEEISEWRQGPVEPVAALSFAASADAQSQAVERALETAKRVAARGGDAVVLIDSLDGLHPHAARRTLAAARNLADGGSLTVIATAGRPFGGESTVIALDATLTSTGRLPALDLVNSGTLRPELLVEQEGADAITKARAVALEARG